jgi:Uma2 family endonuclease
VLEYWILDHARREMTALRRRGGAWAAQVVRPPETYRTPLLRGLEFSVAAVFAAADQV